MAECCFHWQGNGTLRGVVGTCGRGGEAGDPSAWRKLCLGLLSASPDWNYLLRWAEPGRNIGSGFRHEYLCAHTESFLDFTDCLHCSGVQSTHRDLNSFQLPLASARKKISVHAAPGSFLYLQTLYSEGLIWSGGYRPGSPHQHPCSVPGGSTRHKTAIPAPVDG